jgi:hypothetical protein
MKLIERILFLIGLCMYCIALKAQPIKTDCFDSTHFKTKGDKVILDKPCWQKLGIEYNRCQTENELLDSLLVSCEIENKAFKEKYKSNKKLLLKTEFALDSTTKAFLLSSTRLIDQVNKNAILNEKLNKALKNQKWCFVGGTLFTTLIYFGLTQLVPN